MANTLLRSGDIKDFKMLGHDGKAAYLVASQIREMFRVKLGRQYSDCLAIPQRNDQGNLVDWYIPFDSDLPDGEYDIIPWTSASESEQESALILLKEFENKVIELGKKLSQNPNLEGDQLLFSRLIYDPKQSSDSLEPNLMALRFPSNQFVYIVNGKPVITFWGFINPQTPQATSPFYCLEPVRNPTPQPEVVAPPPVQEVPAVVSKPWWKRWWIWLLGLLPLLLLLLAIFWLKGCWFKPSLSFNPNLSLDGNVNLPVATDNQDDKLDINAPELKPKEVIIDNKPVGVVNGVAPNGTVAGDDTPTNSAQVDTPAIPSTPDEGVENSANPQGDQLNPPEVNTPDDKGNNGDQGDKKDNGDNPNNPSTPEDKDKQNVQNTDDKNGQMAPPTPDLASNPDANNTDQGNGANTAQSNHLTLPADVLKQGSTNFLNGQWSVGAGIQDKATGKPLQLSYNFNQGNGDVTLTRSDGVKCTGNVGSGIQNGNLNIAGNNEAICSDNTKYKLPSIQCKPGKNNQADCQGMYDNGTSFPITMKKQ
ncbi:hypothetical protein DKK70_01680 [Gilliamella apicola]|uniref:Virulence factor n=1 Tax=Gilliamella apicola TaxID=1196095 RepID=A0A2V4EC74_9GAMM|nr:SrfA family protein [Gilliamella apicola]PXZ08506.1 hypothetical protein DKK70_01680 [Gilliamella apicola]